MLERLLRVKGGARLRDSLLRGPFFARNRPRAHWYVGVPNLGDVLSAVVLEWITGHKPVWVTRRYEGKVLAIGSILESALAPNDIVWGAGLIRDAGLQPPSNTRFLAVRGPLTCDRIAGDVPQVYGDPALLLPIFHSREIRKEHQIGVVPHYVDRDVVRINDPAVLIIDVRDPWESVVDTIRACEVVVSSSLHGLIVAEAYKIPCVWVSITDRLVGGWFKFNDYFMGTGREKREPVPWERGLGYAVQNLVPRPEYDLEPLLLSASHLVRSTRG